MKRIIAVFILFFFLTSFNTVHSQSGKPKTDPQFHLNQTTKLRPISIKSMLKPLKPSHLTMYDFATSGDLYYSHLVARLIDDDRSGDYKILKDVKKILGQNVANALSAPSIAKTLDEAFSLKGQKAGEKIVRMVKDCALILGVNPPEVWIRNYHVPNAYVTKVSEPHFLVLTSSLLELYENRPNELKFIIGHELGHLKCRHLHGLAFARSVLALLSKLTIDEKLFSVLPPLGLGFLLSWSREAELSSDRAGLLCCQDIQTATQALMRLKHGLQPDSPWLNPEYPDFDSGMNLKNVERWENEPFVNFLQLLKKGSSTHPFIPQRIVRLTQWSESSAYYEILTRQDLPVKRIIRFKKFEFAQLGSDNDKINPLAIIHYNRDIKFKLAFQKKTSNPVWKNVSHAVDYIEGCPVFVEIWNRGLFGLFSDTPLAVGSFYPESKTKNYTIQMTHEFIERSVSEIKPFVRVKMDIHKIQ